MPRPQPPKSQAIPKQARVGELLVQENFITPLDCKHILNVQNEEKEFVGMPILAILERTGRLSPLHRNRLLAHPDVQQKICDTAVGKGLLTYEQLEKCLTAKSVDQSLPSALEQQNILSPGQIGQLIYEHINSGELTDQALKMGLLGQGDIEFAQKASKAPRSFGEICCDLRLITPLDLYYVLGKYDKQIKFGEILVQLGYLDNDQMNRALEAQKKSNEFLGSILVQQNLITQEQCQEALSRQANIPFDALPNFSYDEYSRVSLRQVISGRYAKKNLLLPVSLKGHDLKLALTQPDAVNGARELGRLYNQLNIHCVLITKKRFAELFLELYGKGLTAQAKETGPKQIKEKDAPPEQDHDLMHIELDEDLDKYDNRIDYGYSGQNIQTEEVVNYLIKYGIKNGASDIHIDQDRAGVAVRFRIDGMLEPHEPPWLKRRLQEIPGSIISRIKVMSNLDIAERRLPQDGVFRIRYSDKKHHKKYDLDFRVATCPAITGENISIRILDSRKTNVGLNQLGHYPHVLKPFKRQLGSSAGIVLVTGPTGSGKTSTLYGALQYKYDPALKIITAEDPIEYSFPGIMQTQVQQKIDLTFARLLRSFLRLDPDVILVGEIRDRETAAIAFDAAQTGHLVLATLHTNDSISALSRLLDLGIDRSQIAASLSCVLAQRLVRKICTSCITEYTPDQKEWSLIFDRYPDHLQFFRGVGCESCGYLGYKGRTLLSEVFVMDTPDPILKGADIKEIKDIARAEGMKNMLEDGLLKLSSTTITEICRVLPFDMLDGFRQRGRMTAGSAEASPQYWLHDPTTEQEVLGKLYSNYRQLAGQGSPPPLDQTLFFEFISRHFKKICTEHGCRQVLFSLGIEQGEVEIHASPGLLQEKRKPWPQQ